MNESWRNARRVCSRGALLGIALYLSLTADSHANLQLNLLSYGVAVIWSLIDGIYLPSIWWLALLEGFLVHLACVTVGDLLIVVAGSPFP